MSQILDSLLVEGNARSTAQGMFLGGVTEMPVASEESRGCIVFYAGPSDGTYFAFSFYQCVSDDDGHTFYWHPMVLTLDITYTRAQNAVQTYQKVNGHALTGDISLSAADVGALPATTKIPSKVTDLSNDGVFITQDCSTLANYWTKVQMKKVLEPYCRLLVVDSFPDEDAIDPHALYSVLQNGVRHLYYRVDGQWMQVA